MNPLLFLGLFVSLIATILVLPYWIKKCKITGLLWEDMNKYNHPKNVAGSGGIIVVFSFILGLLTYIAVQTFFFNEASTIRLQIFSLLSVILIVALVGLVDDLLGWKHGGLSSRFRVFLALMASIPLIVINVGHHTMSFPFIGPINLGWIYPIILVPLAIAATTTTYNFLAGFNGLEAGQGIIILSFLSFIAYITGSPWLAIVGLTMVASLIIFYTYNRCPARVFPGDILTYSIGALIGIMAILGNFEKVALFVFIPYILETFLKVRGKLKKYSFGIPDKKNNLTMPYNRIYGLTHLAIFILSKFKKQIRERDVVYFIFLFQIIICLISLLIFFNTLFL
jgi:UDP-N-acetylglucosamine--dolichyl-phosphate N-acetylglucosaminephosphotransferase